MKNPLEISELLKHAETCSSEQLRRILKNIRKKKPVQKKKRVIFGLRINKQHFAQTSKGSDIVEHFMADILPEIEFMPPYAVKAQIVSMFEMLAEAEDSQKSKDGWRLRAARVAMIDNRDHLFSYVATLATGIRVSS